MEIGLHLWQLYGKDTILAVLSILGGGIISLFFYRRSLQRAEISFACEYTRLIWSRIPAFSGITLFHNERQIHDPRRVLFYVWNSGDTTIHGAMIAAADRLRLRAGEVQIINAAILNATREAICATAQLNAQGDVSIDFDYLDTGDGFVIEILYDVVETGKAINACPELSGTIKGIKGSPVGRDVAFENRALKRFGQSTALLLLLFASAALLVFQLYEIADERAWYLLIPKILTAGLLLILTLGMILGLIFTLRSYRIPMKLKISEDAEAFPISYDQFAEELKQSSRELSALLKKETNHA